MPVLGVILLGIAAALAMGFTYPLGSGWIDEVFDGGVIFLCPLAIVAAAVASGENRWPTAAAALAFAAGVTASLGQLVWSGLLVASYCVAVFRLSASRKWTRPGPALARDFLRGHLTCLCALSSALLLLEVWEDLLEPGGLKRFAAEFGGWGILLSLLLLLAAANRDSLAALDPARNWRALRRTPTMGSTFLLAAACFAAFTGIHALTRLPFVESADRVFSHSVFHVGGDFVTAVMKRISSAGGDSMTLYGLPLLAVGLLFLRRGSALRFFAGVILGTAGVSAMAKGLLPRLRPDLVHHRNWDSFPSGHTLSATVIAAVTLLALLPMAKTTWQRAGLWTVAIAWPLLMAASRVYLGRHYVTDVLAGLLLGVAWVAFCRAFLIGAVNLGLDRPDELLQRTPSAVAT